MCIPSLFFFFLNKRNQLGDLTTEAYLFLWDANEKIIVSDIDGTITKSDVIG